MEEADLQKSDETSEVTKILNCGFERFRPVIRCMKDAPDSLEILPVYGPKVFATRFTFEDIALEARCLTVEMAETDRTDIPPILGRKFYDEAAKIRNKLLLYRFRHMTTTNPEDMEKIDLGNIEPRLKQIGLPFAVPFIAYPDVLERFKQFMNFYQKELLNKRSDADQGRIINTMFSLMMIHGNEYVSPGMIAKSIGDGKEISSQKVGKVLNSLRIKKTSRRNTEGQRANFIDWDPEIMAKQLRRYVVEKGDYDDLFNQKPDIEI
ncbi:MAG: hypothetical protein PHQ43_11195, partial [Dehalococcoidales bacterium]|nr:hypothetical protein [Dehalococcoidales bacterium]